VPVYCDISGCLIITPQGAVVFYDFDQQEVRDDVEPRWQVLAFVAASEKFSELRSLKPQPPPKSSTCQNCGGSGKVAIEGILKTWCGVCSGTGWIASNSIQDNP
jgi:hypothetical protein